MKRKVITLERAEADISEAYFYFEEKRIGLGEKFLARIEEFYTFISEMPEAFAPMTKLGIRKAKLRQFPFVVGYQIQDESTVLVLGVLHGSRNPDEWISRLS